MQTLYYPLILLKVESVIKLNTILMSFINILLPIKFLLGLSIVFIPVMILKFTALIEKER